MWELLHAKILDSLKASAAVGNEEAARIVTQTPGLKQYVVIDPLRPETYAQADAMLQQPQCVGIKLHPEEHGYPIRDHAEKLFEFAAARKAIVLTHSSEQNSLCEDFIPWANRYPEVRLILAHSKGQDCPLNRGDVPPVNSKESR